MRLPWFKGFECPFKGSECAFKGFERTFYSCLRTNHHNKQETICMLLK